MSRAKRAMEWDEDRQQMVAVSRRTIERAWGRRLRSDELVHHVNGDPTDDRRENLEVVTAAEHRARHKDMGTEYGPGDNTDLFPPKRPKSTSTPHGHYLRYNAGCRCEDCKKASSDRRRGSAAWKAKYRETVARLEAAEKGTP